MVAGGPEGGGALGWICVNMELMSSKWTRGADDSSGCGRAGGSCVGGGPYDPGCGDSMFACSAAVRVVLSGAKSSLGVWVGDPTC